MCKMQVFFLSFYKPVSYTHLDVYKRQTLNKLNLLLNTVFKSGTGKEQENAFKVVAIGDEYAIMAWLGVSGLSRQSLMKGGSTIDSWKVRDSKSGKKYDMHFEWLVNAEQGSKNMKWPE